MSEEKRSGASSDALEGFQLLAKTSSGAQTVMVIKQVLKHPSIYVFGELLTLTSVLDLEKSPEHKPWLDLLRLFAYGSYRDYKSTAKSAKLPDLSAVELTKLKHLTLVSLAATNKVLNYKLLMDELEMSSVRETEDLVIDAVNLGLVEGALDQRQQAFHVNFAIGRDLGPNDVDLMIRTLESWLTSSQRVLSVLEEGVTKAVITDELKKKEDADMDAERKTQIELLRLQKEESGTTEEGGKRRAKARAAAGPLGLFGRK